MGESNVRRRRRSSENIGTIVPRKLSQQNLSKFGRHVWLCADGVKPGDWLAARIREQGGRCTDRHGNLMVEGKRKPNARAALAVYAEIIG